MHLLPGFLNAKSPFELQTGRGADSREILGDHVEPPPFATFHIGSTAGLFGFWILFLSTTLVSPLKLFLPANTANVVANLLPNCLGR